MTIVIIDWENKEIREIKTDYIKYEEEGIGYFVGKGVRQYLVTPYKNILKIEVGE